MTVRRALYQDEGDLCTLMRAHPHNVLLKQKTHNLTDEPHRHTAALMSKRSMETFQYLWEEGLAGRGQKAAFANI